MPGPARVSSHTFCSQTVSLGTAGLAAEAALGHVCVGDDAACWLHDPRAAPGPAAGPTLLMHTACMQLVQWPGHATCQALAHHELHQARAKRLHMCAASGSATPGGSTRAALRAPVCAI